MKGGLVELGPLLNNLDVSFNLSDSKEIYI